MTDKEKIIEMIKRGEKVVVKDGHIAPENESYKIKGTAPGNEEPFAIKPHEWGVN